MGIRLVCPQGHKLHVKAFLAGKRAICPHCGEKVLVPVANDAKATAGESPYGEAHPAGSPLSLETTIDLADLPTAQPEGSGAPVASSVRTVPNQAAPSVVPATTAIAPVPALPQSLPQSAAATPAPTALGIPPMAPGVAVAARDPIAENPNAVWYVRPKSGGQFGPAPGNMMRQWIGESRVAGDSLVWREGWAEWRMASEVFNELGAASSANSIGAPMPVGGLVRGGTHAQPTVVSTPPAGGAATAGGVRYYARRRSTGRLVALIVVLGLLVISLAVVLVYVVQNRI
jgi:hypothetical protein